MIINGDLNLEKSFIKSLGEITDINGNLFLTRCENLKDLGKIRFVKNVLNLAGTNIKELPDNLEIGASLILRYCDKLKLLPIGLKIKGSLYLAGTNITSLPKDIQIKEGYGIPLESEIVILSPEMIEKHNCMDEVLEFADTYCERARQNLKIFPSSVYKDALFETFKFCVERAY